MCAGMVLMCDIFIGKRVSIAIPKPDAITAAIVNAPILKKDGCVSLSYILLCLSSLCHAKQH